MFITIMNTLPDVKDKIKISNKLNTNPQINFLLINYCV